MDRARDARAAGQPHGDATVPGVDAGGLRGENTPNASAYDRQPAPTMVALDAPGARLPRHAGVTPVARRGYARRERADR